MYSVIYLAMSDFAERFKNDGMVDKIKEKIRVDILVIVDDWDAICREFPRRPGKNVDSPAIIFVLKVNKDVDSAIDQIRRKNYPAKVLEHASRLLLVGISYDRESKQHFCRIEKSGQMTS